MSLLLMLLATAATAAAPVDGAPQVKVQGDKGPPSALAATSSITVYKPDFFASAAPVTALDMINRIPGFTYDGGDAVRGFAGAASNVLIDGQRVASKSDGTDAVLNRIGAGEVDRIELIRGSAPGVDMQGRTVMANVIRKSGDHTRISAYVQDNLFADGHTIPGGKIEFSKQVGAQTIQGSLARYSSLDDSVGNGTYTVIPTSGPQTTQNARTAGHGGGVGATLNYKGPVLDGDFRANLKLEETYFNNGLSYGLPATTIVNDHNRGRDGELGVNYDRKFGAVDVELLGLQHLERDNATEVSFSPGDASFFGQNQRSGESILRATARYAPTPTLTLETGGEGAYNFLVGTEHYIDNGAAVALPSSDVTVDEKRGEVFGTATWKINPKLSLETGARFEYSTITESGDASQQRSFFYAKPRALLTWDPFKDTELRLRIERKVGQLDFTQFVSSVDFGGNTVKIGNPNLRPDQRWQYEAALEQRFWGKGSIVVTALHEQITDVADYIPIATPSGPQDAPGNIGSGTSDQLDIEGNVPLDKLGIPGGLLKTTTIWRVSDVTDPVTHQSRRISGQRPDVLQGEFDQDLPQWKSNWGIVYFKGWRESYYRLGEVDHFHIGNQYVMAFWEYKPSKDIAIRVEGDNLIPFKFYRQRAIYDGSRDTAPLDYSDYRTVRSQPRLMVKIRKTL